MGTYMGNQKANTINASAKDDNIFSNLSFSSSGGGTLISVDTNNDGNADFQITLDNGVSPTASDFIF